MIYNLRFRSEFVSLICCVTVVYAFFLENFFSRMQICRLIADLEEKMGSHNMIWICYTTVIEKKEETIFKLLRYCDQATEKCQHLETLLERQALQKYLGPKAAKLLSRDGRK